MSLETEAVFSNVLGGNAGAHKPINIIRRAIMLASRANALTVRNGAACSLQIVAVSRILSLHTLPSLPSRQKPEPPPCEHVFIFAAGGKCGKSFSSGISFPERTAILAQGVNREIHFAAQSPGQPNRDWRKSLNFDDLVIWRLDLRSSDLRIFDAQFSLSATNSERSLLAEEGTSLSSS